MCHVEVMDATLAYSGCTLDRAGHRRGDEAWLTARLGDPASRFVPVWRDRILVEGADRPRVAALTGEAGQSACRLVEETVFLGVDDSGATWFACDLSGHDEHRLTPLLGGNTFDDLGRVVTRLGTDEGAVLAYARSIVHWHRRHRFCGACGGRTEARQGGHLRVCTDAGCGVQQFPRTDPVVIMLVTRIDPDSGNSVCLLARQKQWIPGLVSALAGFVEPGETIEEAVRREVHEETGLTTVAVRYYASQPWPFPASLMLGFRAEVDDAPLHVDREELEDARWFKRDEVARIRTLGLRLPFRGTIARSLVEGWLAEGGMGGD
ncbi:MAG TPA: NAD(+) diphosphatase [Rhodospirillales bacterium]|nr:NAD(+) diphosphatase [Rhodospirillales bacterium]